MFPLTNDVNEMLLKFYYALLSSQILEENIVLIFNERDMWYSEVLSLTKNGIIYRDRIYAILHIHLVD